VFEKASRLGGQLHLAAAPPGREEFEQLAKDLTAQLTVHAIPVVLATEVTAAVLEQEKPDRVILATGARPVVPPIPGVDLPHVVQAWDVLVNRAMTGQRIAVLGGGSVGVETALFLAQKGTLSGDAVKFLLINKAETPEDLYDLAVHGTKKVVLIEMVKKIGKDIGLSTRWGMLQELSRIGVDSRVSTHAVEITSAGVIVETNGEREEIQVDSVVLALGSESHHPFEAVLNDHKIPFETVGDARSVATAFDAVHAGFKAGKSF
jgi:2,4-dienoyl-CoA reductase (NADPH2)